MKILHQFGLLAVISIFLTGCAGMSSAGSAASAPAAVPTDDAAASVPDSTADVMRVGDKVTMRLTGVPDDGWLLEKQIPESGDVTVPLLTQSFHLAGRNASDAAMEIATAYKSAKIYTNPNVSIIPEERYVNVGGDVRGPSRVLFTSDLTLLSAINACGGFTEYANRKAVRILRGKQIIQVDASAASRNPGTDPSLRAGDQIYVPRTMW